MEKSDLIKEFLLPFRLNGDGSGFWDSYEGHALWLGERIQVSIAARSVSQELALLYQKVFAKQQQYDILWKEFAVRKLLPEMKMESGDETLTEQQILPELRVGTLTFGFDRDGLVSAWFRKPKRFCEHTVLVYGGRDGKPIAAVME